MNTLQNETTGLDLKNHAGKYLIFKLGQEEYGLEILKVQEIIGMIEITKVPKMPEFMKGVINLRGKIIPVMDLRLKFNMENMDYTERTCIIVVQYATDQTELIMGIIVDEVSEVEDIKANNLEPPPIFGASTHLEFILGIGKINTRVVMLLDIDGVITKAEADTLLMAKSTTSIAPVQNEIKEIE